MFSAHRYVAATALTIGLGIVAPACAAQTYGYQRGEASSQDFQRRAYENGYRAGFERGLRDANDRRTFSYERFGDFRDADKGYRRGDGDREFYGRAFRQGFERGYREAFDQSAARYGNRYPYPAPPVQIYPPAAQYGSPAARIGYRDGLEVGRDDARDRERYDPARSGRYRSADHDYDRRYGSKDEYQREYRAAFAQGYAEGYRSWRIG